MTSVGKFLRKLRIDNGEILKTMAVRPGVSSAFLSAVENGKKKMPQSWHEKLAAAYSFTDEQKDALKNAVIGSGDSGEINLQNASHGNREPAVSFARQFDSLNKETSRKILEMLNNRKED